MKEILKVDRLKAKEVRENGCVSIGRLSSEQISEIAKHNPGMSAHLSSERDILFWEDRIAHTERHRDDFFSLALYEQCFRDIPRFIRDPDYIASKGDSLMFIRKFSQDVAVAIRVSISGKLSYRTMYVLTDAQLEHFISRGTAWKC